MRLVLIFFVILVSVLSGDSLFRSKAYISNEQNIEVLDAKSNKKKRTLRVIEREVIEPDTSNLQEETSERALFTSSVELEEFLNVFYIDQNKQLFVHPKSVLDLRVVTNSPSNSLLYFGFEKDNLELYEFPIRPTEGANSIFYADRKDSTSPDSFPLIVDSQNPVIIDMELIGDVYSANAKQVFAMGTELEIKVADSDSGIKAIRVFNQRGKLISSSQILFEQKKEHTEKFSLRDPTLKHVIIEVEDNVSNIIRTEPIPVQLDGNPPIVTVQVEPTQTELEEANGICAVGTILSVNAVDSESEVTEIQYRYPNKEWRPYKSRLILANPGEYKIEFRAKDYFGNISLPVYFECTAVEFKHNEK